MHRYSVPKSMRKFAKIARLLRELTPKSTTLKRTISSPEPAFLSVSTKNTDSGHLHLRVLGADQKKSGLWGRDCQEDSEKSFIAHACFYNVKVGMKVAVVAFVEVSICFLKLHAYYFSNEFFSQKPTHLKENRVRIKGQHERYCSLRNEIITCIGQCYTRSIRQMNYLINLSHLFKKEDFIWE